MLQLKSILKSKEIHVYISNSSEITKKTEFSREI